MGSLMRRILAPLGVALLLGACGHSSSGDPNGVPPGPSSTTTPPDPTPPPVSTPPTTIPPVTEGNWTRSAIATLPDAWEPRDGAEMVQLASGRILLIGGWNPSDVFGPNYKLDQGGGDRVTNEVWKSDDQGKTWQLLLPHLLDPPTTGPNARFIPSHCAGVVAVNGHALVIGNDGTFENLLPDVWLESNNGTTWTRISTTAPTWDRVLFMAGTYKNDVYVMGGQEAATDPNTAKNDVWRSQDGGRNWTRLANAPWSPRGMVYRPVEHAGKLYVVGGALYAEDPWKPSEYNGVFAFDGTKWETILPDGHKQFGASGFHRVVSLAGRLWLLNGFDYTAGTEYLRAIYSDDNGLTWKQFPGGAGGQVSHADAIVVLKDRFLRISGNESEKTVWEFLHVP